MSETARDRILARIRAACRELPATAHVPATGPRPAALATDPREELSLRLQRNAATVVSCADRAQVATELAGWLRATGQPGPAPCGNDPRLARFSVDAGTRLLQQRQWQPGDLTTVSHASLAIAETGSLLLQAGPENPASLNFLPDHHAVLLCTEDIVSSLDDAWRRLGADLGRQRACHLISGPSRTADIEQTIELGAHGPRQLQVFLYPAIT